MNSGTSPYPNLFSIIDKFETRKNKIAFKWMNAALVKELFLRHRISIEKFASGYAPGIIAYFIGVIKGEKTIGDCPVMNKFVTYMILKGIAPHEVYVICSTFRKELTEQLLLDADISSKFTIALLNEVAFIFDTNFSGVLSLFNDFFKERKDAIKKFTEYKKKLQTFSTLLDISDINIFVVQSENIIFANKLLLGTLGLKDLEDLHLKFKAELSFLKGISFETESFEEGMYESWMQQAIVTEKAITATIFNPQSREERLYDITVALLPESEPKTYLFSLRETALPDNNMEKDFISKIDKVTGLNSYAYFKSILRELEPSFKSQNYGLIVVELTSLEKINREFGYEKGDRLLIDVAQKVKSLSDDSMIIARLSGNRIGVVLSRDNIQRSYDLSVHLRYAVEQISQKNRVAFTLYNPEENSNHVELRAYNLLDSISFANKRHVITDVENIDAYDILENQDMFMERFRKLAGELEGLVLFKELIIKSKNTIRKIMSDSIYVAVSSKQLAIASVEDPYYLHAQSLGYVRSVIVGVNRENSLLKLARFEFDEHTPFKRKMMRVKPDAFLELQLIDDKKDMEAKTLYLNEEYISFELKRKRGLQKGKLVFIELSLKDEYLELEGSVYKLEKNADTYKCVVHLHHTVRSSNILKKYISARQLQIIKELNAL